MTRLAIDPSTLLAIAQSGRSVDSAHQLVAPDAIRADALDLLLGRVRSGELDEDDALELHDAITGVKVRLLGDRVSRRLAWRIASDRGATVHEAQYVSVARLQADALVTSDPRLAALAAGVVRLAELGEVVAPRDPTG